MKTGKLNYYKNAAKPAWVKKEVIRLKAILGQKAGCRRVAQSFYRLHANCATVGKTYVATVIRDNHYLIMQERRKMKNKLPRWVAINDTWAMDELNGCLVH